jgi:hypothetical protein
MHELVGRFALLKLSLKESRGRYNKMNNALIALNLSHTDNTALKPQDILCITTPTEYLNN